MKDGTLGLFFEFLVVALMLYLISRLLGFV